MRTVAFAFMLLGAATTAPAAQDVTIPVNVERLAARAVETVNVTVDGVLLQLAGKFLSSTDPDQTAVKNLIGKLKGIYVRSFKFANEGEYSEADVESLRSQLPAPVWSKMVTVRSRNDGETWMCSSRWRKIRSPGSSSSPPS